MFIVMIQTADIDSQPMPVAVFSTREDAVRYASAAAADVATQHFHSKYDIPEFGVFPIAFNPAYANHAYPWTEERDEELQRMNANEFGVISVEDVNTLL